MTGTIRFPFVPLDHTQPEASLMPLLPLRLAHGEQQVELSGLLDTGAAVNVLPYYVGEQLGLTWEQWEGVTEQIMGRYFAWGGTRWEKAVLATKV